jgi:hypothetical protein
LTAILPGAGCQNILCPSLFCTSVAHHCSDCCRPQGSRSHLASLAAAAECQRPCRQLPSARRRQSQRLHICCGINKSTAGQQGREIFSSVRFSADKDGLSSTGIPCWKPWEPYSEAGNPGQKEAQQPGGRPMTTSWRR